MKRFFDLTLGFCITWLLLIPILLIAFLIYITSKHSVLCWSDRVGKDGLIFKMPKFRTMIPETPEVATALLVDPEKYFMPFGCFLRTTSLDELPQIFSILKGDMSFVGPRPALFNQYDLIALRKEYNVDKLITGLTGWAQINGRDSLLLHEKVAFDVEYYHRQSMLFDFEILWKTLLKVFRRTGVSH